MNLRSGVAMSLTILTAMAGLLSVGAGEEEGFTPIFNGNDLEGWLVQGDADSFRVVEGAITRVGEGSSWIYTKEQYGDFVLKLQFQIEEGGNSGIFFRVADPEREVWTGIEVQVFGDYGKPADKHSTGSIYDLVAPRVNASRPHGQWNDMTLECDGNWIRIDLNGQRIVEMDLDKWTEPAGKFPTAYAEMPRKGRLGFQNHGSWVAYRNVRIKKLNQ